jgi:hypothetical protein
VTAVRFAVSFHIFPLSVFCVSTFKDYFYDRSSHQLNDLPIFLGLVQHFEISDDSLGYKHARK